MKKVYYIAALLFVFGLIALKFVEIETPLAAENDISDPAHQTMNPGWEAEWRMFKEEEGQNPPSNILAYYRDNIYAKNISFRGEDYLTDVVEMGPDNIGGRTRGFLIDAADGEHFLAGGISGGLWESFDRGESWVPKSDKDQNLAVTFIAQNPFNPDILFYSTGEVTGNSTGVNGIGLFRSLDGGVTFELLPASRRNGFFATWRVVCSKTDSSTLYVAGSKGLFVSRDMGESFEQVLFSNCTDIELLSDSTIIIGMHSKGVFIAKESTPDSIQEMNIPFRQDTKFRRVEMAYCASNEKVMYAAFEDEKTKKLLDIFKSIDGGVTWEITNPSSIATNYTWYCHALAVHPDNPDLVIYGSVGAGYSTNGGKTWKLITGSHADRHLFYFHPEEHDLMYVCSDGGIDEYVLEGDDYTHSFRLNNGYNITQFYTGAYYTDRDKVLGGTQDNGTLRSRPSGQAFTHLFGGDGSFCAIGLDDNDKALVSYQGAKIYSTTNFNGVRINWTYIMKDFENKNGGIPKSYFINPVHLNPFNSDQIIFIKRDGVWLSEDFGNSWKTITKELENPYCQTISLTNTGHRMFLGGSKSLFYRVDEMETSDSTSGVSLESSVPNNVKSGYIRGMVMHPYNDSILYLCYSSVSKEPRFWKVSDILSDEPQWESISGDLPAYLPANDIAISSVDPNYIVIGTDYGLYTTKDGGETWVRDETIPNVSVHQVKLRDDFRMYAFTHGRGIWSAYFEPDIVATQDNSSALSFGLYPNPVLHEMTISWRDEARVNSYQITGISGNLVQSGALHNSGIGQSEVINVASLPKGSYFIQILENDSKKMSRKFIKL